MKAITYSEYGSPDVLHVQEMPMPELKPGEVLVRVHAAHVNFGDLIGRNFGNISARQFNMPGVLWLLSRFAFGLRKPSKHVLGSEFSGRVEAVGAGVTRFSVGDAVFGYRGQQMGTYAEYITMPADGMIAPLPTTMTLDEAATVPYGALTALTLLRKANLQPGQRVLIIGASGGIGGAAVQLAKHAGAHVTGICSTPRLDYVRALGADEVIDYTREDFTRNGEVYDLIFDVLGRGSFNRSKRSLKVGGLYLMASFKMKQVIQMLITKRFGRRKLVCAFSNEKPADLMTIHDLIESGHYRAIVDRAFPMTQAADAHRYAESGGRQASIVIRMGPEPEPVRAQKLAVPQPVPAR